MFRNMWIKLGSVYASSIHGIYSTSFGILEENKNINHIPSLQKYVACPTSLLFKAKEKLFSENFRSGQLH